MKKQLTEEEKEQVAGLPPEARKLWLAERLREEALDSVYDETDMWPHMSIEEQAHYLLQMEEERLNPIVDPNPPREGDASEEDWNRL